MDGKPFDRRRWKRIKKVLAVRLQAGNEQYRAATVDLSPHGAFVNTYVSAPPGALVQIIREMAGEDVVGTARVVRSVDTHSRISTVPGLGVAWLKFSAPSVVALSHFLRDVLELRRRDIDRSRLRSTGSGVVYYVERRSVYGVVSGTDSACARAVGRGLPAMLDEDDVLAGDPADRRRVQRFATCTEAVFYARGLPHVARVLNLSRQGVYLSTQQAPPPIGERIRCKTHLTGRFSPYWVRFEGPVVRYWSPPADRQAAGFAMRIDRVDELGQPGLFLRYLRYLAGLQQGSGMFTSAR